MSWVNILNGETGASIRAKLNALGTNGSGRQLLSGSVDPVNGQGNDGDHYLNTATYYLFGPKASGVWPTPGHNLTGPSGAAGSSSGFSALFTSASGMVVGSSITRISFSGYSVAGLGGADYIYDAAVDSTYVTANPRTSFIAADNRGFKLDPAQRLNVDMFGAIATVNDSTTRAINDAAFKAACEHRAIAASKFGSEIHVGPFIYYLGVTLEPEGAFRLIGQGSGHINASQAGTAQTRMIFPTDVCPIRVRANGTDGLGVSAGKIGANDSYVRGICFEQLTMGTSVTAYGVHMRGNATFEDCAWVNCPGNGIHIFADSSYSNAATAGFCDEWRIINCFVHSTNGHGIYTNGSEANAGYSIGLNLHQVGKVGIFEASYFANAHYSPQITGYGQVGEKGVFHLGRIYQLITPNPALGSTTTPGTNATIWYDMGTFAAASAPNWPQWVNGNTYDLRLPFLIFNGTVIYSGYQENGANIGSSNGLLVGGTIGGIRGTNALQTSTDLGITNSQGFARFRGAQGAGASWPGWTALGDGESVSIGALDTNVGETGRAAILQYRTDVQGSKGDGDFFDVKWQGNQDITWTLFGQRMMTMGGRQTTQTFGRSTTQPGYVAFSDLVLRDASNSNNARVIGISDVTPPTGNHARGEFIFNVNPTAAGTLGWSCTTTGTPGTWTAVPVAGFGGTYTGNSVFTGNVEVDGLLTVMQVTNYGLSVIPSAGDLYLDNQKPAVGYGYDIIYRTGRSHIFQCSTASDLSATVQDVATVNTVGLTVIGKIVSKEALSGIGYATGAGGTVTQATSKSTGVTLNKVSGQITMNSASLATGASVSFTLTNSAITATDMVMTSIASGATADSYHVSVTATSAGSCRIQIRNFSAGALGEALVLNFAVIKAVTS